jgi:hypothetical protein
MKEWTNKLGDKPVLKKRTPGRSVGLENDVVEVVPRLLRKDDRVALKVPAERAGAPHRPHIEVFESGVRLVCMCPDRRSCPHISEIVERGAMKAVPEE